MGDVPLHKRPNHCFISYASEDAELAQKLATWLTAAGLNVWFDKLRLGAGTPVLEDLTVQMCQSRACLFVLTNAALAPTKNYVKHEVDIALEQQVSEPGFAVLAVRTDPGLNPTARFPALRKLSWADLPGGELTLAAARRLLLSVTPGVARAADVRHIYVSCGWGEKEHPVTLRFCRPLAARGVRLVGDARDQRRFGEEGERRIERIMSGCGGHLLIVPERRSPGKSPEEIYKYFLAEWRVGRRLGLPRRTFCVSRSVLPMSLQDEAIEIGPDTAAVSPELVELHDQTEAIAPYVFLSTDYKGTGERIDAARDIIEHVLGMECHLGRDYKGEGVREAIIEKVIGANVVIADLASAPDASNKRLVPNVNTCVEAGAAMGARRPLFVTALDPESFAPGIPGKTAQLPFMFRNDQIEWYSDDASYLARIHSVARALRRRIINDEIGTPA